MRNITHFVFFAVIFFVVTDSHAEKEEFPGRSLEKYSMVSVIELEDLHRRRDEFTIVDVRSSFEYDTLRIKGAVNIPVGVEGFDSAVQDLREQTGKPIAFYCNGHTCLKSYKATKQAMTAGLDKVYAYDAGIFFWARAYPDEAELLGKSPVDAARLIPKKVFKGRQLDPDTFSDKATSTASRSRMIIDIRDTFQRAGVGFFPAIEHWASLQNMEKLRKYLDKAKAQNRTLFIYDNVGKQVRWLQYELEARGLKNYWFMEKGAKGYYDMLISGEGLR